MTELRANNINVLPSCLDCVAGSTGNVEHCRRLIDLGLCRLRAWLLARGLAKKEK